MFHMYGSIHVSDLAAQERGGKLHHPLHIIHVACRQGHLHLQWTTHPFDPDTLPTVTADDLICPPRRRITVFPSGLHGCPVYFSIEFLLFLFAHIG